MMIKTQKIFILEKKWQRQVVRKMTKLYLNVVYEIFKVKMGGEDK